MAHVVLRLALFAIVAVVSASSLTIGDLKEMAAATAAEAAENQRMEMRRPAGLRTGQDRRGLRGGSQRRWAGGRRMRSDDDNPGNYMWSTSSRQEPHETIDAHGQKQMVYGSSMSA